MFNVFRSDKSKRIVMGVILLIVSAGMLLYLVPNYDTGNISSDTMVAKVGDTEITINDVRKQVQNSTVMRRMNKIAPPGSLLRVQKKFVALASFIEH